ncbi:BlaI/MecI/CopY family transcriptional regulator [Paenibacillus sp. GCM10027626]|uniref:BlaI/MecI/CopY family transcriptional regulator n=1 Tax=Paenibacillus sp. GCM10027626 TaxID=3273411 RepID=UPI00364445F2
MEKLGRLSETEMEIMEVIWRIAGPVTVAQLLELLESKGWKTSTMSTLLKRLIEKGFLAKTMSGKTNYYGPVLTWQEYQKHEIKSFLDRLYKGKVKNFFAALVGQDELIADDIAELKQWFQREEGKKR